jgi:glucose 1-dehydrogenase
VIIPDTIETPLEGGPTTKELIEQAGGTAFHLQTDIADWNAVDRMLQATIVRFGPTGRSHPVFRTPHSFCRPRS